MGRRDPEIAKCDGARFKGKVAAAGELLGLSLLSLPPILYVPEMAQLLGKTPNAVRIAVSRGHLPRPRRVAGRNCWLATEVVSWLSETCRVSPKAKHPVKITACPHPRDKHRMQVTFNLPSTPGRRNRPRKTAPAGMDRAAAIAWGHSILNDVLREHMLAAPAREENSEPERPKTEPKIREAKSTVMTMGEFWTEHIEGFYLERLAPGSRRNYREHWRDYIAPVLAEIPLDHIGREEIKALRKKVRKAPANATRNAIMGKVRTMLQLAVREDIIDRDDVPAIHKEEGGTPPKETPAYSSEQIEHLIRAAEELTQQHRAVLYLFLDTFLRVSEVCALRWGDVDLDRAMITIRHNLSDGQEWRPKSQKPGAKPKSVGMPPRLVAALRALPRRKGTDYVLPHDGDGGRFVSVGRHTRGSIRILMGHVQVKAGVPVWTPHKFRHTGVSALANSDAPILVVRDQARHRFVSTTERYIHTDGEEQARKAASFLAAMATGRPPTDTKAQETLLGPN